MATTHTTTQATTETRPITYTLLVVFTVDEHSGESLRDTASIRDEAASWLDSLNATVRGVSVRPAD
jgi:hypothetical protein